MKFLSPFTVLITVATLNLGSTRLLAAGTEGVALAVIYDTSGSMKDPVRDRAGKASPKYVIANRALITVARQIQTFATNSVDGAPRQVEAGLYVFRGDSAREAVKFGPFDAGPFQSWAEHFSSPSGNTPLGNALSTAAQAVLRSPLSRKHVLIITDGENTAGPAPSDVLSRLQREARGEQASLAVHFIAFDVDAKVFAPVKKLGATVVAASDENQLNSQLQFILQRKILLEDEEPAKKH